MCCHADCVPSVTTGSAIPRPKPAACACSATPAWRWTSQPACKPPHRHPPLHAVRTAGATCVCSSHSLCLTGNAARLAARLQPPSLHEQRGQKFQSTTRRPSFCPAALRNCVWPAPTRRKRALGPLPTLRITPRVGAQGSRPDVPGGSFEKSAPLPAQLSAAAKHKCHRARPKLLLRACSTKGVFAGSASLRSNTPFIVRHINE